MKSSIDIVDYDSINAKNLQIVVKPNDTIPHFVLDENRNIKAYKSFPMFVKNISGKSLILKNENLFATFGFNQRKKWQVVWNNNFYICGYFNGTYNYFILEPDEIIVFAIYHFTGKQKTKLRIGMSDDLYSKEFEGFINPKVFKDQRIIHELDENTK